MTKIRVTTTATADIEETWEAEVTDRQFARLKNEPNGFLDMMTFEEVDAEHIADRTIGNEEDREVLRIEEVPDGNTTDREAG